jgi:UDP-3-O-[3-hydroxymyristoyl] N-acetylglucosamine deacetylase
MAAKKTIHNKVALSGVGIHSGKPVKLNLIPSDSGEIIFKRSDLGDVEFHLDPKNIETKNCTMLVTDKGRIRTLEHLLAALWVFGIDSVIIELDEEEIPAMDGSAFPFVQALHRAGVKELPDEKRAVKIEQPFILKEKDSSISVVPDEELKITYYIEYDHPVIGRQGFSIVLNPENFEAEIAPARTFGFLEDIPELQKRGLALGGSLKNAVVLDKTRVISGPLRSPDEFVRHKILDLVGDLSLLRDPVKGHFIAKKAGHDLHLRAVRFLLENPDYLSPDD